jgi:hypothetical protein
MTLSLVFGISMQGAQMRLVIVRSVLGELRTASAL